MKKNILAIDDEIFIRELVQDFLEMEDIDCKLAANLEESLKIINNEKFDLILLDRNLEDKLADEVITELRKVQQDVPIIMMTGDLDVPETFISEYKISAVLHKPFQYDVFVDLINNSF